MGSLYRGWGSTVAAAGTKRERIGDSSVQESGKNGALVLSSALFARYRPAILGYRADAGPAKAAGEKLPPEFLLARDGALSVYYAPFDYLNPHAQVVLLGIAPGLTQAKNAIAAAQRALVAGQPDHEALRLAKLAAGFSGAMRAPLVEMLDTVALHFRLGIESSAMLFGARSDLLQPASAVAFPAFVEGKNYNGTPGMVRHPLLLGLLESHFLPLVRSLKDAVFVPLGPKPTAALDWAAERHGLRPRYVLRGLPHPSGANAERVAYFLGRKARAALSAKTDPDKLDEAKRRISELLKAW